MFPFRRDHKFLSEEHQKQKRSGKNAGLDLQANSEEARICLSYRRTLQRSKEKLDHVCMAWWSVWIV